MKRLCEIKSEMFPASLELVKQRHDFSVRLALDELKCPLGRDHCNPDRKCQGLTPANLQRISELEDILFRHGFVHITTER